MIPWETLGRAQTPDGAELVLYRRAEEYVIRVRGTDLMSSWVHGSEERMAQLTCAPLKDAEAPRVLIGGLGMGYTLRAALDALPAGARVVVAELVPAVVEWNRGPLKWLAEKPLEDPRVTVEVTDVGAVMRRPTQRYDVILLDVDNGPTALTRPANGVLYSPHGLETVKRALRPGGVLSVWSAFPDPPFAARLERAGFKVEVVRSPARGPGEKGGTKHTLFFGRVKPALGR